MGPCLAQGGLPCDVLVCVGGLQHMAHRVIKRNATEAASAPRSCAASSALWSADHAPFTYLALTSSLAKSGNSWFNGLRSMKYCCT